MLVDLANELAKEYDVTIFTIYAKGELEKQVSPQVTLKSLYDVSYEELSSIQKYITMPIQVLLKKNRIYKKYIKDNYEVEIAFLEGPITRLFSVKNNKVDKIAWIHNDISLVFGNGMKAQIKKKMDEKIYAKYKTLVFVSKDNLEKFNKTYGNLKVAKKVIYNYIDSKKVLKEAEEKIETEFDTTLLNFTTVARLVKQKGIDRVINVHKKLLENNLQHKFYIIGDGPEKEELKKIIEREKVKDTFVLLGKKENPYPYIKKSDYFCLLSRFEGYGMVLEEAKILNKPIIITNTAAREALTFYENSYILENTQQGIYEGLEKIMKENKKEKKREIESKEKVYDNTNIIEEIKEMIGD